MRLCSGESIGSERLATTGQGWVHINMLAMIAFQISLVATPREPMLSNCRAQSYTDTVKVPTQLIQL
jgi:hypothetical protein